jgi:hypothetical protein
MNEYAARHAKRDRFGASGSVRVLRIDAFAALRNE